MIELVIGATFPMCLVVLLIGCLNCLRRKKKAETFRTRDTIDGRLDTAFSVDVCQIPTSEQVVIEPLPDILSKVSIVQPQRPQIICGDRSRQEATLPSVTVHRSFPRDHLTYLNEIGSGWFGKVIESEAVQTKALKNVDGSFKSHVVVKMLKDDATKLEQTQFLDEVNAFRYLEDANIMSLLGQCTETAPFLVILEFATYGSLKNYLVQNNHNVEEMASNRLINFALDVASGLACLQRHDYIHNDLAARNCLVMSDYTVKIGDYGITDHLFKNEYYNAGSELLPIRWMAPEILSKVEGKWTARSQDKSSDMWSFGVLLWEICSLGERPYDSLSDEAVLQEVVVNRRLLPSEGDLKIPLKDHMWSVMIRCWQTPSERLNVEQIVNYLDQLSRIRVDTNDAAISDFDQKWNQLEQNQARVSSMGIDLGSRIALAGSFVNESSASSSSDKQSIHDDEGEAQDGTRSDDFIVNVGGENKQNLYNQSAHIISTHSNGIDHRSNINQQENFKRYSKDEINIENELSKTHVSPSHLMSPKISDETGLKTSTPVFQAQNLASNEISANSSLSSDYLTANETLHASVSQLESFTDNSNLDKDISLDVEGKTLQETMHDTLHKPTNQLASFALNSQAEDEDFSDFVRTSPTAPSVDFTDFTSADQLKPSNKAEFVVDSAQNAFMAETAVEPATDAAVSDSSSFSDFTPAVGVKDFSDDELNTFSEFVTSTPSSKANNSIIVVAEVNAPAFDIQQEEQAQNVDHKNLFPSLGSALSDISLLSGSGSYNQNNNVSKPGHVMEQLDSLTGQTDKSAFDEDTPPEKMESLTEKADKYVFDNDTLPEKLEFENVSIPTTENLSPFSHDADLQKVIPSTDTILVTEANSPTVVNTALEADTSSPTEAVSPEQVSTTKVVPDQNQNIFTSDNIILDFPSLISDTSLASGDLLAERSPPVSLTQPQQLESFTDFEKFSEIISVESFSDNKPTTNYTADNNPDIFDLHVNSSNNEELTNEKQLEPSQPTAHDSDANNQINHNEDSINSDDKFNFGFESIFDSQQQVSSKQEANLDSLTEADNFEQEKVATLKETND